jgi:hypothetical protein
MAKPLTVIFEGSTINFTLEKVDRSKLYGYIETNVLDEAGKVCELATLTNDGHSIVGRGGTAIAHVSPNGQWRKRSELRAVDVHGQAITPVKSTFDAPITLEKKATIEEYLSHNVHLVYRLIPDEEHAALNTELKSGLIFQFHFSYRGGLEASAGFLMLGSDGNTFLCVGTPTAIEYAGLKATAAIIPEEESAPSEEEDLLDFSVM